MLFVPRVGYCKLLTDEQSEALQELNKIIRAADAVREAQAAGQLMIGGLGDRYGHGFHRFPRGTSRVRLGNEPGFARATERPQSGWESIAGRCSTSGMLQRARKHFPE